MPVGGALERLAQLVGLVNRRVWRVGHISAPLDYVPRPYCSWEHRFDDPQREYRTLYSAERPLTCLREVLGDLRPNTKARAEFIEFQLDQGVAPADVHRPASEVTVKWRQDNALASATVRRSGPLADLDDRRLLEQLADAHAAMLAAHGMPQLDVTQVTSKDRPVTQAISRDLYEHGAAGLLFRSNHDAARCIVLFEGRAELRPSAPAIPMTEDHPALLQVCGEYGLILRSPARGGGRPAGHAPWRP